jgi:hypothetical protein
MLYQTTVLDFVAETPEAARMRSTRLGLRRTAYLEKQQYHRSREALRFPSIAEIKACFIRWSKLPRRDHGTETDVALLETSAG